MRSHPALVFFLFLWFLALLDPDPDLADQNPYGYGPETLLSVHHTCMVSYIATCPPSVTWDVILICHMIAALSQDFHKSCSCHKVSLQSSIAFCSVPHHKLPWLVYWTALKHSQDFHKSVKRCCSVAIKFLYNRLSHFALFPPKASLARLLHCPQACPICHVPQPPPPLPPQEENTKWVSLTGSGRLADRSFL